jgi:hypothetical protein
MTSVLKIAKGSLGRQTCQKGALSQNLMLQLATVWKDCVVKLALPSFHGSEVYGKRLIDPVLQITTLLQ